MEDLVRVEEESLCHRGNQTKPIGRRCLVYGEKWLEP